MIHNLDGVMPMYDDGNFPATKGCKKLLYIIYHEQKCMTSVDGDKKTDVSTMAWQDDLVELL